MRRHAEGLHATLLPYLLAELGRREEGRRKRAPPAYMRDPPHLDRRARPAPTEMQNSLNTSGACAATAQKCVCWWKSPSECAAAAHYCVCWAAFRGALTTCAADKHDCVCRRRSPSECVATTHHCVCWFVVRGKLPACAATTHECVCLYMYRGDSTT